MSLRDEQCNKVCRILDDVLANRPTERDALIVAVRTAFDELKERKKGRWLDGYKRQTCSLCKGKGVRSWNYCPYCGADMIGERNEQTD